MSPLVRCSRPSRVRRTALAAVLCAALTTGAALEAAAGGPEGSPSGPREDTTPTAEHSAGAVRRVMDRLPEHERPADGPGENILLAGLDRRHGMTKAEKNRLHVNGKECHCTDVLMLVHVSADRKRVSTVSIPRDSYVTYPPHDDPGAEGPQTHRGKINGAYQHGGPALTVRTVERVTGVRIDHYAEADFAGFAAAVDRSGGGEVCTGKDLHDENAGLDLPAGRHGIDGRTALRWVRARHVSPPGDLGRVRRQQQLVERMLIRLAAEGPVDRLRIAVGLKTAVRTDDGLDVGHLARLGADLHGLKPEHTEFATVPMSEFDHRSPEWGSALLWDRPRADALFEGLREDRPLTQDRRTQPPGGLVPVATPPQEVVVRVEGQGRGPAKVRRELKAAGFRVNGGGGTGGEHGGGAVIAYRGAQEKHAQALGAALPQAELRREDGLSGPPVVRVGPEGAEVVRVVYDRSSVEGAPVTGDAFDCGRG